MKLSKAQDTALEIGAWGVALPVVLICIAIAWRVAVMVIKWAVMS